MPFRNKAMTIPSLDDIVMQIMGMSEALYNGDWSIGSDTWNNYRPPTWPTAKYLLKVLGYSEDNAGWDKLLDEHIGVERKTMTEVLRESGERRAQQRWQLDSKPNYSASPDGKYLALMSDGFAICQATYERTGRMILR